MDQRIDAFSTGNSTQEWGSLSSMHYAIYYSLLKEKEEEERRCRNLSLSLFFVLYSYYSYEEVYDSAFDRKRNFPLKGLPPFLLPWVLSHMKERGSAISLKRSLMHRIPQRRHCCVSLGIYRRKRSRIKTVTGEHVTVVTFSKGKEERSSCTQQEEVPSPIFYQVLVNQKEMDKFVLKRVWHIIFFVVSRGIFFANCIQLTSIFFFFSLMYFSILDVFPLHSFSACLPSFLHLPWEFDYNCRCASERSQR